LERVPQEVPISRVLGLVWNCTDVVPGIDFDWIQDNVSTYYEPTAIKRRTYAAVARFILGQMKEATSCERRPNR
jgi:hypothetical protein